MSVCMQDSSPVMRKRKRADDEDDMDADCSEGLFYGCGIHRTNAKKQDFKYGMEYKAKVRHVSLRFSVCVCVLDQHHTGLIVDNSS